MAFAIVAMYLNSLASDVRTINDETLQYVLAVDDMNLARSFNNWRKYRQTVNELGRMTDRELCDLGIGRSDIPYIARKASN